MKFSLFKCSAAEIAPSRTMPDQQNQADDEHDRREETDPAAQCGVRAVEARAAPFGEGGVRDELVLGPFDGDVVAALEPEGARPYLDGAAVDGEDGRAFGLGVMPAVEVQVGLDVALRG
ncbi:hypothetical protein [Streptomyces sp. NPDC057253]|uniref:hypothetical protein n=1 Tax=Streptomyces sp. NPDC057253 TaxID=3346069 RepID=UPI003645A665